MSAVDACKFITNFDTLQIFYIPFLGDKSAVFLAFFVVFVFFPHFFDGFGFIFRHPLAYLRFDNLRGDVACFCFVVCLNHFVVCRNRFVVRFFRFVVCRLDALGLGGFRVGRWGRVMAHGGRVGLLRMGVCGVWVRSMG